MADTTDNKPSIYYIPENFIGESRLLNGRIRTRYLIDSIVLSLIAVCLIGIPLIFFALKDAPIQVRITLAVIIVAPGFVAGQIGFNGDPISVFLKNFFTWMKMKQVRIFNEEPRLLGTDPVKTMYEQSSGMDKFVNFVQDAQKNRIERKNAEKYIEGETFEFQYDPGIDGYLEDSGDYDSDSTDDENMWPSANVSIEAGGNLDDLEALLSDDWYSGFDDAQDHIYGLYGGSDDEGDDI